MSRRTLFTLICLFFIKTNTVFSSDSVERGDVYLYLYNQSYITTHYAKYTLEDYNVIANSLDLSKVIFIWTHGWDNVSNVDSDNTVGQAILNKYDVNQIYVDYPYEVLYTTAVGNTLSVGGYVGDFIQYLNTSYNYPLSNVKLGGHSLGAHISGIIGKTVDGSCGSIIGLDPAGPGYLSTVTSNRLTPTDAQYVQGIHTNAGEAGITFNVGDSDFYPNGGSYQPGCLNNLLNISCSHYMAIPYYISTIQETYTAVGCSSTLSLTLKSCSGSSAVMGGFDLDTSASGAYYLTMS